MSRYIDADKYKDFMDLSFEAVGLMAPVSASLVMEIKEYVKKQIDGQPPADAVEVVRCKDCVYYSEALCKAWSCFGTIKTPQNGYCHMAERKTKGETNE